VARHNRLCAVVALALVALSACGVRQNAASEPTPTTRSTASTTATTTPSTPPPTGDENVPLNQENRCTAPSLAGSIEPMESTAGNRYVRLVVRNTGTQTCTLSGYGNVDLLNATRQPIPTNAERTLNPVPSRVRLGPGEQASKILHWNVMATGDEPTTGPCQPPASALAVTPPDETESFQVSYEFGSVCDHGRIETSAYYPG
jgi:Domain of unknown function (DUF4232)